MVKSANEIGKGTALVTTPGLVELAAQINAEHEHFDAAVRAGLSHARNAGELLLLAKPQVKHGEWLAWLKEHCPRVTARTAQRYMQVASRWDELAGKCDTVSHLSFQQAVQLLAEPGPADAEEPKFTIFVDKEGKRHTHYRFFLDAPPGYWAESCRLFWDLQAKKTVLLDALGWSARRISTFLGADLNEVQLILRPAPPVRFDTPANGSELVRSFDDTEAFVRAYHAEVKAVLERILSHVYGAVLSTAEEDDHFAKVRDEVQAMYQDKATLWRKKAEPMDGLDFLTPEEIGTAACCALTDARAALGIEPARPDFVAMWEQFHALPVAEATA